MKKQFWISFFLLCFTFVKIVHAQNIDSLLAVHRAADPQEKMYVQFDKEYYNPGETIWFKAYLFTGAEQSEVSKNFYAELIDSNGTILHRIAAVVGFSSASGSFDIASGFADKVVYFRAYTTGMLNGDTSFLYFKPIQIIVAAKTITHVIENKPLIRFFPEGGNWVAGLQCVLAFEATDKYGNAFNTSGYITSGNGKKVTAFSARHDGMGVISIQPQEGETYSAVWKDAAGKEITTALPPVKSKGIILGVSDVPGGKKFTLQCSANADEPDRQLRIIATMNQQLVFSARADLSSNSTIAANLPVRQLLSGILQITVFDRNNSPVAERITFVNNHEYAADAGIGLTVKNTGKRGLNTGEISVSDTIAANLSLSVTDADLNVTTAFEDNIISHLLLTADLRGKITNPYYYFSGNTDSAASYIDLVMLTHGWRRYNWENIFAGKLPKASFTEGNFLAIRGQLTQKETKAAAQGFMLNGIIRFKDSSTMFISLPVDNNGVAATDGLIFYDSARLYIQFPDQKMKFEKAVSLSDNGLLKPLKFIQFPDAGKTNILRPGDAVIESNIRYGMENARTGSEKIKQMKTLQEVIVRAKIKSREQKLDEKYAGGLFRGGDARSFDVINDPFAAATPSVFQYLQGKVAGLQVNTANSSNPSLHWRGGSPAIYVDEISSSAQLLSYINMADIAYIKVFSSGAGLMSRSLSGAIAVYTKKGNDANKPGVKAVAYIPLSGYTAIKEFYSPDYATPSELHGFSDYRTTLYWQPYIFLRAKARSFAFRFYNNDVSKRFRLILEGVNDEGRMIHIEKLIE